MHKTSMFALGLKIVCTMPLGTALF